MYRLKSFVSLLYNDNQTITRGNCRLPQINCCFSILTVRGVIFMEISEKAIQDMQRQVDACSSYIDALARNSCRSPEKVNTMLDAAMQK